MGVVTNLPGWLAQPLMEAVDIHQYFRTTVTPRWGVRSKPQPHGIRKALQELGAVDDSETYYVGDTAVDAEAAKKAAVRFAWASYGYETDEPENVAVVLHEIGDLLDL